MPEAYSLKFRADGTLGRLVRWLRASGYDAVFDGSAIDRKVLDQALKEGRIVLTRRRDMSRRNYRGRMIIIEEDSLKKQIPELKAKLPELSFNPENFFTICLECGSSLTEFPRERARAFVPPYVYETQQRFNRCPSCLKIYWAGTHRERAEKFLLKIIG